MNEEIYEGAPSQEDVLIGTNSGYNRYKRPDGSTYVHYPYNRMATVTAYSAKDKNGQPIRTAEGKLITGKTQAEADRKRFRYDQNHWIEANRRKTTHLPNGWRERIVTPDLNTFNAITGGTFNLTPIQIGRGIYNLSQGKDPGFILGNSGVVSEEYAQEHPWLALGANVLGEGLTGGFIYGAPKLYKTGVRSIKNYRMSRAFDNIVKSEIKRKDWFNKNFPQYTYKPQPYNNRLGLPESDPNTFYHYMYYPSPININGEGVVRFSNFTVKPKYNGSNERIWWDKGYVPTGDVVLSSKSKYIDEHVLSHPEKYSPYRGYYENSYYTSGDVPINEVNIYTKNPFTGYYDGPHNTITYNPKSTPLKQSFYTDNYGKEIIPTPYNGSDNDLIDIVQTSQIEVLNDYFNNPLKIEQIKNTMQWNNSQIEELQNELIRSLGNEAEVKIKNLRDGFKAIGTHNGKLVGKEADAEVYHTVTLNRDRIPNLATAEEGAIHELGGHGKMASMNADDFNIKGSFSNQVKDYFPRIAQLTQKNKELADELLILNRKGKLLSQFKNSADLELYFDKNNILWDKYSKFKDAIKRFKYVNSAHEKEARAYTGQLFERLHPETPKTTNILQLEEYFTPESVENFKKAVLGISPAVIGVSSLQDSNKTESKNKKVN